MRVSLARALFVKPSILLLDEPTNHLDLDACVWLEEELKTYKRILVLVSHSQDFLNGVCTNIIHMTQKKLFTYTVCELLSLLIYYDLVILFIFYCHIYLLMFTHPDFWLIKDIFKLLVKFEFE